MQVHEHHLLPLGRRKDLLPPKSEGSNRHRQAVPVPNRICRVQTLSALRLSQQSDMRFIAWCFQGREESRLFYYTNNRRRCQSLFRKKDNLSGDPSPKPKKLPCAVIAEEVCKKLLQTESAVAAQGSSGGWERGLGRGRPPTKGGRPLPKVFLPVRPRFASYAIALIFLVNWLFL